MSGSPHPGSHQDEQDGAREERRRFFRVDDDVSLSYRTLEGEEIEEALSRFSAGLEDTIALAATFATTSNEMRRSFDSVKRDFPELAIYLDGLNTKLDILARLIVSRESGLADHPTHAANLSAGGISFNSAARIEPGSLLELRLLIFPSHICVLTLGAVVNCTQPEDAPPEFPYRLGVDFSYIREADRELLIKHVVQRQSALLRQRRGGGADSDP